MGWGYSSVGRASDWHAADAGSITRCGKSTFSADSLTVSVHPPCAVACISICAHVKDPVVRVRVRWIVATQNIPSIPYKRQGCSSVG